METQLTASMEDYLEAIYLLEHERGNVRVKDVAMMMDITMPSVSGAIKNLERQGLVEHAKYDLIVLTPEGMRAAEEVYRRHRLITAFFSRVLGLDEAIAEKDACGIEHILSPETLESLSRYMASVEREG